MNPNDRYDNAWVRLARRAGEARPAPEALPYGFATRVLAQWKGGKAESPIAFLEWLTVRGLAVALFILLGSAAFGYESLIGVFTGETAIAGGWLDSLLML